MKAFRLIALCFAALLLATNGVSASMKSNMDKVMFDVAELSLPKQLVDLLGRSLVTALDTIKQGCDSKLEQLDSLFAPATSDILKEYDAALKAYEQELKLNPESAKKLRDEQLVGLRELLKDADSARDHDRQKINEECEERRTELYRNRIQATLLVVREMYTVDPAGTMQYAVAIREYLNGLDKGLDQCKQIANMFGMTSEVTSLCQEEIVQEAVQFLLSLATIIPEQIRTGFPGLPTATPGSGNGIVIDEGSAGDVITSGDFPNILMPGPVIIEPPFDDDDLIDLTDISGDGPPMDLETPTGTVTATSDSVTTTSPETMTTTPPETVTTASIETVAPTSESDTPDSSSPNLTTGSSGPVGNVDHTSSTPDTSDHTPSDASDPTATEPFSRSRGGGRDHHRGDDDRDGDRRHKGHPHGDGTPSGLTDDDDDDTDKPAVKGLYIALIVAIAMLMMVLVFMVGIVLFLRQRLRRDERQEIGMSDEDKLSLMKEGYVNPTYQFFDKQQQHIDTK